MTFIYANFTTINVALNFGEKKKERKRIYVRGSTVTEVKKTNSLHQCNVMFKKM